MSYPSLKSAAQNYFRYSNHLWNWYSTLSTADKEFQNEFGSWSVNDVFYHLMTVEEMVFSQVNQRLASGKIKKAGLVHRRNAVFLFVALWLPKKYKAPIAVSIQNDEQSFAIENWKSIRLEFEELIANFPIEHKSSLVFKHPLAGPLLMQHGLKFLTYHLKHHFQQLRVLAKAGGFEKF